MNREEAIKVLREILEKHGSSLAISSISLSIQDQKSPAGIEHYELHLACRIDDCLRQQLNTTLEEHQLKLKEAPGVVIIY